MAWLRFKSVASTSTSSNQTRVLKITAAGPGQRLAGGHVGLAEEEVWITRLLLGLSACQWPVTRKPGTTAQLNECVLAPANTRVELYSHVKS